MAPSTGISPTEPSIASTAKACVLNFDRLSEIFDSNSKERQKAYGITQLEVSENYGQFKIWAENIGAMQARQSPSSLDYRLRDTPNFATELVSLLRDLEETLGDVCAIASGERANRTSSPTADGDKEEQSDEAACSISEIQELFQSIPETIACLFNLSVLIRNNSTRDRYAKAVTAGFKSPFEELFDIDHVGNKFPHLRQENMTWLRIRLGKAITQRRQYLRYCREHRENLSKSSEVRSPDPTSQPTLHIIPRLLQIRGKQLLGHMGDVKSVVSKQSSNSAPTTASTVQPAKLENPDVLEEQIEDDTRSQTSYATSVDENDSETRLSVIRLEAVAQPGQTFECPYCWTIQKFSHHNAWRKHVMTDLKPYVCTAEICDMKLFADSQTWFTHELQNHLVEWHCCFCPHLPHETAEKFEMHVRKTHADKLTNDQLAGLVKVCQRPLEKLTPSACKICNTWEATLRDLNKHLAEEDTLVVTPQQLRHHVRRHMEQLALFAIPRGYQENGDAGSSRAARGRGSEASLNSWLSISDDEYSENPRLHVAAFEGNFDEVIHLLDTGADRREAGETWGSALGAAAAGGHLDIVTYLTKEDMSADLPRSNTRGWGPLHWAAAKGHHEVVQLLLTRDMNPAFMAKDGNTPYYLAQNHGHESIVNLMKLFNVHGEPSGAMWAAPTPSTDPPATVSPTGNRPNSPSHIDRPASGWAKPTPNELVFGHPDYRPPTRGKV